MQGAFAAYRKGLRAAFAAILLVAVSTPAMAIEFWDGRLEIHGFYEQQVRAIWDDFTGANDLDLTQWYHVLNLEIEGDIAPDGFGPFDLVSAFARIEARFDCVWRRGCYVLPNIDVYGDRPGRLPQRIQSGHEFGYSESVFTGDTRREFDWSIRALNFRNRNVPVGSRRAVRVWGSTSYNGFFGASPGLDGRIEDPSDPTFPGDDPALLVFENLDECLFASRQTKGPTNGQGRSQLIHNIRCKIEPIHDTKQVPNPFRSRDFNDRVLGGAGGGLALPFRPAPEARFDAGAPKWEAQGVWYPNERLQELLRNDKLGPFDQNFTVNELQWNRGASQQDEKELKEAYLEFEAFDSRLWVRAGKQNIVWGKTELFRTTDQFNPQDLALASLPNLEESRIALWAVRAIWSFYEVGPFEDVRVELAANYDQFEPADIGRCGEPYSPLVACGKTFGLLNHGQNGIGLAGEIRPPQPWNSWKGIEVGGRVEWRWDRFSFAITDFYGYSDFPFADVLFTYSHNVDPVSGRPRKGESTGRCRHGTESDCLTPDNALREHSANQTAFAWVCAGTVGVSDLDSSACAQNIWNSRVVPPTATGVAPVHLAGIFGAVFSGQNGALVPALTLFNGNQIFQPLAAINPTTWADIAANAPFAQTYFDVASTFGFGGLPTFANQPTMLVPLNMDLNDGASAQFANLPSEVVSALAAGGVAATTTQGFLDAGLSAFLTDEQEALLGCGPFYGTNCDIDGIDFLNADSNALFEAFPRSNADTFRDGALIDTFTGPQPGTVGFDGFTCAHIAGCRGPGDDGYDPRVDGTVGTQVHPITGQPWRAEIAIVSWNFLMGLIVTSSGEDGADTFTERDRKDIQVFNPDDAFAKGRCSFREPIWCSGVKGLLSLTGTTRASVKAGGNGRFGRRQFLWHGGNDLVLRYEKRNVLGFSMDFAEDVLKSNWSFEFTWIEGVPTTDADSFSGHSKTDNFNLTVSVDRPTFINFLNANRTFFINSQWFFQYRKDLRKSHVATGPFNAFFTFAVNTGYFQDRLLPSVVFVYDIHSNSGAVLPQITYRFNEAFSLTFGLGIFEGRFKQAPASVNDPGDGASLRIGKHRNKQFFEPGLSVIRERDEIFMRLRYTF